MRDDQNHHHPVGGRKNYRTAAARPGVAEPIGSEPDLSCDSALSLEKVGQKYAHLREERRRINVENRARLEIEGITGDGQDS